MSELDDRVVKGLRDLVDQAPVDAEVWAETESLVARSKHRRQAMAAVAVVAVAAVVVAVGVHSTSSTTRRVRVATTTPAPTAPTGTAPAPTTSTPTTTPTPAATTAPVTSPPPVTTIPITTPATLPAPTSANPCPGDCIGRATADVDGDGRPDQIGLSATPPLSGQIMENAPSKLVVSVVFADGRVAEYDDTAAWDASLVGAVDLNGDGKAEIFYFNDTGANLHSGHILRWDGSQLVAVQGADGKPFSTFISGYAMGGDGFRCVDNSYEAMTIGGNGQTWDASEITYRLIGNDLVKVSDPQPIPLTPRPANSKEQFYIPPQYDQIIGVHCPGMPASHGA